MIILLLFCFFWDQNFGNRSEQWYRQTNLEISPNIKTAVFKASLSRQKSIEDTFVPISGTFASLSLKIFQLLVSVESKGS